MNCANHPDRERAAFCQHCGKPLCTECVRNVGNSIFCETCLAARVSGAPPVTGYGYPPGPASYVPGPPLVAPGEPNPGLAALLGFIPGVGAMYNEQYAKGIVHLVVFAVLVSLTSDVNEIFLLFVFGWEFYMAIEAHHTARARRDGLPLPNPFGLNDLGERLGFGRAWPTQVPPGAAPGDPAQDPARAAAGSYFHQAPDGSQTYSAPGGYYHRAPDGSQTFASSFVPPAAPWGAPQDVPPYGMPPIPPVPPVPPMPDYSNTNLPYYRRFPSGAIWLIVLGLFFLVGNNPFFHMFHGPLFGPILVIGVGVWIFVRRMTFTGHGLENDGSAFYQWRFARAVRSAFWVILTGVIWLLDELHILTWAHSWPIYMIAAGVMMVFRRSIYPGYGYGAYGPPPIPPVPPSPPSAPAVTSTELAPRDPHTPLDSNPEGR